MPLEIRELLIKTTVSDGEKQVQAMPLNKQDIKAIKNDIIKECMERMRDELFKDKER